MIEPMKEDALMLLHGVPVLFAGFQSCLGTLFREGWKVYSTQNIVMDQTRFALVNTGLRLVGNCDRHRWSESYRQPIHVGHLFDPDHTMITTFDTDIGRAFLPMRPHYAGHLGPLEQIRERNVPLSELFKFEPVIEVPKTPALIVDINDVQSLFDQIVTLQRPKQAELREKSRKAEKRIEANIISFSNYGT